MRIPNARASGAGSLAGALIVLAELAKGDAGWLDALRRAHYPAERNRVPAHLTLFRSLPPSSEDEIRRSLAIAAGGPPPKAWLSGVMDLDGGVAIRIESAELGNLRDQLADAFHGLLTAQDLGKWTPHVTIQNKVEPRVARKLLQAMRSGFEPRPIGIAGLQLVRYREGAWEPVATWRFR